MILGEHNLTNRVTFTLEKDAYDFLRKAGGTNKSAYINHLLKEEKRRMLKQAILKPKQEEAEEPYQEELADWDMAGSDGLDHDRARLSVTRNPLD